MPKLKKHSVIQKSYQCDFCKVKCRRPQDLRRHLFVHTEASFQCDRCGNKFTRYDTLMRHKRDNCRNSQPSWMEREAPSTGPMSAGRAGTVSPVQDPLTQKLTQQQFTVQQHQQQQQQQQPISMAENIHQASLHPMQNVPQNYGAPQAYLSPVQPIMQSIGASQPLPPQPLNAYNFSSWAPPPASTPHIVGTSPQPMATTSDTVLAAGFVASPPRPGPVETQRATPVSCPPISTFPSTPYFPQSPIHSTVTSSPGSMISTVNEGSGAGTRTGYNGSSNGGVGGYAIASPPHDINKELPKLSTYAADRMLKKENSLQPLEPNPIRFNDTQRSRTGQISEFPLKRDGIS